MSFYPSIEPCLLPPEKSESLGLIDFGIELKTLDAQIGAALPQSTLRSIRELLRIVNSYYSNIIEGNPTEPKELVAAVVHKQLRSNPNIEDHIQVNMAHIRVQELMEKFFSEQEEGSRNIFDPKFLCWLHESFYEDFPEEQTFVEGDDGQKIPINPGHFRARDVVVGRHVPPAHDEVLSAINHYFQKYDFPQANRSQVLLNLPASHHRLMWIHPFVDGNGRIGRLFLDAMFMHYGFKGYGIWNISRGFARHNDEYKRYLAGADAARAGDLDGRGALSQKALYEFSEFFYRIALDQVRYMTELLEIEALRERWSNVVKIMLPDRMKAKIKLTDKHLTILEKAFFMGEIPRASVPEIIDSASRTARKYTGELLDAGLLDSDHTKAPVRIGFPSELAELLFPNIFSMST